ncbi:MAG: hypothetical protein JWP63_3286 [Candidatus Solibacter sp.]|nr:hypothetical protein [Candidatus Solibacter sp.]
MNTSEQYKLCPPRDTARSMQPTYTAIFRRALAAHTASRCPASTCTAWLAYSA